MPKPKPRRGPAPKPPEELSVNVANRFPPDIRRWLAERGSGSPARGLKIVVTEAYQVALGTNLQHTSGNIVRSNGQLDTTDTPPADTNP